jgi:hypothetical protein
MGRDLKSIIIWGFSDQCLCIGEVLLFLWTPTTSGTSLHQVFQSLLIWLNQSLFQGPVLCQWLSQEFRSQPWLGWQLKCMPKKRECICVKVQEQLHWVVCLHGWTNQLTIVYCQQWRTFMSIQNVRPRMLCESTSVRILWQQGVIGL